MNNKRISGSERFIESLRSSGLDDTALTLVVKKLDNPVSVRDLIDVLFEQVEINVLIGRIFNHINGVDPHKTRESVGDYLTSLSDQTNSLERLLQRAAPNGVQPPRDGGGNGQ